MVHRAANLALNSDAECYWDGDQRSTRSQKSLLSRGACIRSCEVSVASGLDSMGVECFACEPTSAILLHRKMFIWHTHAVHAGHCGQHDDSEHGAGGGDVTGNRRRSVAATGTLCRQNASKEAHRTRIKGVSPRRAPTVSLGALIKSGSRNTDVLTVKLLFDGHKVSSSGEGSSTPERKGVPSRELLVSWGQ